MTVSLVSEKQEQEKTECPAVLTSVKPQVRSKPDERALRRLDRLDAEIAEAREAWTRFKAIRDEALAMVVAEDEAAKKAVEDSSNLMLRAAEHLMACEVALEKAREVYEECQQVQQLDIMRSVKAAAVRAEREASHGNPKVEQLQKREENLRHRRAIHVARHGLGTEPHVG